MDTDERIVFETLLEGCKKYLAQPAISFTWFYPAIILPALRYLCFLL
jgi:hypothetical protein